VKDENNMIKFEELKGVDLITCPICGFNFRAFNSETKQRIKDCPMCGFRLLSRFGIDKGIINYKLK